MEQSTLVKLRVLEKLCEAGYADEVLDRSLNKLLAHQRTQVQTHLEVLAQDLQAFEVRYGISSAEFLDRYQRGDMGDSAEVIEWYALYRMHTQLLQHLALFQESDGGADPLSIS